VDKVASPPYDVLNSEEARQMAGDNPVSFLRVSKAEIEFEPGFDAHSEAVYQKAAENLKRFIRDGVLIRDEAPCFYVYELTMGDHVQRGIVLGASVEEYEKDLIKKHELTRRAKEDDRAHHVDILDANSGPVFLTYRATQALDKIVAEICTEMEPVYDFVAPDGIRHVLWVVADECDVAAIREGFGQVDLLYVADGHHRSAAAFRVRDLRKARNPKHTGNEPYNHFLAVVFPDDQLQILGYYRVVKDLNGLTSDAFLKKLEEKFVLAKTDDARPAGTHLFTMYLDGQWYGLGAREGTFPAMDPVKSLDCSILQDNVLAPVLGIADPRTDERIDFIGGIRGTGELERRCKLDMKVAFALYPVTVAQLMAIADVGQIMPPKSTWFEPKLRSGVVVRSLSE
jgi:uncharacterized protein (DUF1015 family)